MKWVHDQNLPWKGQMLSHELVWKELNNISTRDANYRVIH